MNKDIIEKRSFIDVQKLQRAYNLDNLISEMAIGDGTMKVLVKILLLL